MKISNFRTVLSLYLNRVHLNMYVLIDISIQERKYEEQKRIKIEKEKLVLIFLASIVYSYLVLPVENVEIIR